MRPSFCVDARFQGPTGSGQGGWTAFRFAERIGVPVAVSIAAPIPLDTELTVVPEPTSDEWTLVTADGPDGPPFTVMTATRGGEIDIDTAAVTIDEAAAARRGFTHLDDRHPVPRCFSCGLGPHSMRVHAAGLPDGDRFATDWTVPDWAVDDDGRVDVGALWAALDCTSAWYVCNSRDERVAFTVRFAARQHQPLGAGETYALVGWSGGADAGWVGRKRHAAAMAFAADGACVARSTSLWVSVDA